jgi:hypothetical protein
MAMNCDVTLRWGATPEELTALGNALWRWCNHTAERSGVYQHLDNQALADLLAGRLPASSEPPGQVQPGGVRFRIWDDTSVDRRATIHGLRQQLPTRAVEDIAVEGKSWDLPD